ncbi:twitching motility protein PilT [Betaproteobacteria bacterium]|nr:twitching motility protein PilT [Betaproteobacteria bacterium]GHU03079.1 twitching motility protein PilT [Betaproteobacteria bacterium]GHU22808.1 twitching motility protein PilT [Betaproteobacteria bacterium]GHU23902.1 twitching motility protein PilT [Betaproteobacteria bacterium]
MKALFDTNVVIDYLVQRQPFYDSARNLLQRVLAGEIGGVISAGTVTDIYYIVAKHIGTEQAVNTIKDLVEVLEITDTKASDIEEALKLDFPDFEDAVQCAVAIRLKVDYIFTRNVKDFQRSPVAVISPAAYLEQG